VIPKTVSQIRIMLVHKAPIEITAFEPCHSVWTQFVKRDDEIQSVR
jgi:hypothetical protein